MLRHFRYIHKVLHIQKERDTWSNHGVSHMNLSCINHVYIYIMSQFNPSKIAVLPLRYIYSCAMSAAIAAAPVHVGVVLRLHGLPYLNFSHNIWIRAACRHFLLAWTIRVVHELQFCDVEDHKLAHDIVCIYTCTMSAKHLYMLHCL